MKTKENEINITNKEKLIVDKLYSVRYDYFIDCATNILKKLDRTEFASELVTQSYLYIMKNAHKMETMFREDKMESVVVRYMTMQIVWSSTEFKKTYIYRDDKMNCNVIVDDLGLEDDNLCEEEYLEEEMTIQNKVNTIKAYIAQQDLATQTLYRNVYEQGINTSGKLAKHIGINRTSCYYLIRNLRNDIVEHCKQNSLNDNL